MGSARFNRRKPVLKALDSGSSLSGKFGVRVGKSKAKLNCSKECRSKGNAITFQAEYHQGGEGRSQISDVSIREFPKKQMPEKKLGGIIDEILH